MSKPTIRDLLDQARGINGFEGEATLMTLRENDRRGLDELSGRAFAGFHLAARVEAVLRLHEKWSAHGRVDNCSLCWIPWPCPTIRALEGEKSR